MENSFYYFFSATPQVLGGTLALFGVFVIFKIQALKDELLIEAKFSERILSYYSEKGETDKASEIRGKIISKILEALPIKDIKSINDALNMDVNNLLAKLDTFNNTKLEFTILFTRHQNLINETLKSSKFTAIIVVFCLVLLPFGKWIICYPVILMLIFIAVIICVAIIFYKLYEILKKSFT